MAETTVVDLSESYTAHGKSFKTVTLRRPVYREIYQDGLGRPQELQPGPNGKPMVLTYAGTVDAYLQKLIIEPGYECIGELSAIDAMKLEVAVCDFFRDRTAPKTPPTP
jgi:hypothetical protein